MRFCLEHWASNSLSLDLLELVLDTMNAASSIILEDKQRLQRVINKNVGVKGEHKALVDVKLENFLKQRLQKSNIALISEENQQTHATISNQLHFIIDPLDGTYNFVRGLGSFGISVALWHGLKPIFGVINLIEEKRTYWGGSEIGAFCNGTPINVSNTRKLESAAICGGFPVRFLKSDPSKRDAYFDEICKFEKVRMLGSAAKSLICLSEGACDAYFEEEIMIWDIAGGLAILQGAGGTFQLVPGESRMSFNVKATNGKLPFFKRK